jgi:hypothetical protein
MQAKMLATKNITNVETSVKCSEGGILYTIPHSILWTAKGYGYQAMATSAVAALVVRPTTVAMATLYNNGVNVNFVIERAFAHNLVAAAQSDYALWLCVHPTGMTAPTNDIAIRNNTSGRAASANGIFDNGATVVADGWFPWSPAYTTVTITTPGGMLIAEVGGRIILPPTAALSLQVVASVNTATFCAGFHWFEVPQSELGTF